tara:strand:- start:22783 stop:23820 length:1038 start_codon:yes stop_codon:yes gene_type:complete
VKTGNIANAQLNESSGLAASRLNPGAWWSHNDSGGRPRLYALDEKGTHLGTFTVQGASNFDWEDMAAGPCPNGAHCLYIGGFGDNNYIRPNIMIYRVLEPKVDFQNKTNGTTGQADVFTLTYPDGAHNCETLLIHPKTRDIILVTKEKNNTGIVYMLPGDKAPGKHTLKKVATLNIPGGGTFTGGDISPFGDQVMLRTYNHVFLYAVGSDGIPKDSNRFGTLTPPAVSQGESLAYDIDGINVLLTTENAPMPIYKLPCVNLPPRPEPKSEPAVEPVKETSSEPSSEPVTPDAGSPKEQIAEEPSEKEPVVERGCGCSASSHEDALGWLCLMVLCVFVGVRRKTKY